jgi:putative ATPase
MAINQAQEEVQKSGNLSVPLHLRNAPSKLMKELGYGKDYLYSHDKPNDNQEFLPNEISGVAFYRPSKNAKENVYREALKKRWKEKYNY